VTRTIWADRVQETHTEQGNQTSFVLNGPTPGNRAFSAVCQDGDQVHVSIVGVSASSGAAGDIACGTVFWQDTSPKTVTMTLVAGRAQLPLVQIYSTPGTYFWDLPRAASLIEAVCVGGGGGGGSGRIADPGDASTNGGAGGGAGGVAYIMVSAASVSFGGNVVVGSGGSGGAPRAQGAAINGLAGSQGGQSSFDSFIRAGGGAGGAGGATGAAAGGVGSTISMATSASGGAGPNGASFIQPVAGGGAVQIANGFLLTPCGGGGGGNDAFDYAGAAGGGVPTLSWFNNGAPIPGGPANAAGSSILLTNPQIGTGGGGGNPGSGVGTIASSGGNGGSPGGGGGGGGGNTGDPVTLGVATSGAGGIGGNGLVVVIFS
jgi:hypothetical protein